MPAHNINVNKGQQVTKHENLVEPPWASDSTDPLLFFFFNSSASSILSCTFLLSFILQNFLQVAGVFQFWNFRSTFVIRCSWQSKIGIKASLKLWWYPGCSICLKSYTETLCNFKVALCATGDCWAHHIPWHALKLGLDAFASQGKNTSVTVSTVTEQYCDF